MDVITYSGLCQTLLLMCCMQQHDEWECIIQRLNNTYTIETSVLVEIFEDKIA